MIFKNVHYVRLMMISACLAVLCWGCNMRDPLPIPIEDIQCRKIKVAPGPEDFVLDTWHGDPRLLISSHDRRDPEATGGIYYFDIKTEKSGPMLRINEPDTIVAFKPHGMDIRRDGRRTLLYVIIHDPYAHQERLENAIVIYEVRQNDLRFVEFLESADFLWSPNDLSVLPSGDFYVTNDIHGSMDLYTRTQSSEITYFDHAARMWKVVANDIAFANGILAESDRVYVTAMFDDQVLVFPREANGDLGDSEQVVHIKGADNLTKYGDSLLTTAHYDDMAFYNHMNNPEDRAPSVVFRIRPEIYSKETVFVDEGEMISAASTAMIYGDKLYISQVFDPYLVVCGIPIYMKY